MKSCNGLCRDRVFRFGAEGLRITIYIYGGFRLPLSAGRTAQGGVVLVVSPAVEPVDRIRRTAKGHLLPGRPLRQHSRDRCQRRLALALTKRTHRHAVVPCAGCEGILPRTRRSRETGGPQSRRFIRARSQAQPANAATTRSALSAIHIELFFRRSQNSGNSWDRHPQFFRFHL
jgi:hypothetical protein